MMKILVGILFFAAFCWADDIEQPSEGGVDLRVLIFLLVLSYQKTAQDFSNFPVFLLFKTVTCDDVILETWDLLKQICSLKSYGIA